MTDQRKDLGWLQDQLVDLLRDARSQKKTDHAACAKYADLLFKVLPKGQSEKVKSAGELARELLKEDEK